MPQAVEHAEQMISMTKVWANPIEEAAWREKWCRRCFQQSEVMKRVMGTGDGCPLLIQATRGALPTQWKRRRNAIMSDTYKCSEYLDQPKVNRRAKSDEPDIPMFNLEPHEAPLIPVDGWPDWKAQRRERPEKL